jgi:hypothetical protein
MEERMADGLYLKAADVEDLTVMSRFFQTAFVAVGDISYDPDIQLFALIAYRLRLEALFEHDKVELNDLAELERVHSLMRIEKVTAVKDRGLDALDAGELLVLLDIVPEASVDGRVKALTLIFADDVDIRLEISEIQCFLDDTGDQWPPK